MCVCGQAICRIRLPKIYVGISTRVQKSIVVFFFFCPFVIRNNNKRFCTVAIIADDILSSRP